jgi:hypothetical protein
MPKSDTAAGRPSWTDYDRSIMPAVEPGFSGIRTVLVGWIGRLRAGVEVYAPVPGLHQGGGLQLTQAQVRHLHAELGRQIERWDTEPRDLIAEADEILRLGGHTGRKRASTGYEIETDGTTVYVYHSHMGERGRGMTPIGQYAHVLAEAGYTGPDGSPAPAVHSATGEHAARVIAVPPPAESF